jgi:hypothetical protein
LHRRSTVDEMVPSKKSDNGGALLEVVRSQRCHHAIFLPDLDIVSIDKLLGGFDGCGVVLAI